MRVVIQRVSAAHVSVAGCEISRIGRGLLVLHGIEATDTEADGAWLAQRLCKLRIFSDSAGSMNLSVSDISGEILVVSQFTLFASLQKGTRPSFHLAARAEQARPLYDRFVRQLGEGLGRPEAVRSGEFGAMMQVSLVNDGPVTLIIDSKRRV